jgi:hypothetical protein
LEAALLYRCSLLFALALLLVACPTDDDDSAVNDDDSADDDDVADDDDAVDDDDSAAQPACEDIGGVVLTLDGDFAECKDTYTFPDGVDVTFSGGACGAPCSGSLSGGDMILNAANARIDTGALECMAMRIEVDLTENAAAGSTQVMIADGAGNILGQAASMGVGAATLELVSSGKPLEGLGVSGCDVQVHEIRLF